MKNYILFALVVFSLNCIRTLADQRSYVWTYQYMIMERGKAEIEQYTTFSTPELGAMSSQTSTELSLEAEIGMSEHFDFAVYQVFKQGKDGLKYDGFKLRERFLFGEKGRFLVDPLVYFEYKGKPDFSSHSLELKLILAKDFGDLNISVNPYTEFEKEGAGEWEIVPKYAAGISYRIFEILGLGLEGSGSKKGNYIGPTITHGIKNIWVAAGAQFPVGYIKPGNPEFKVRAIIGLHL